MLVFILGVKPPAANRLQISDVYDQRNKPRCDILRQHFFSEGRLTEDTASRIISDAISVFRQEKVLLEVPAPVTGF